MRYSKGVYPGFVENAQAYLIAISSPPLNGMRSIVRKVSVYSDPFPTIPCDLEIVWLLSAFAPTYQEAHNMLIQALPSYTERPDTGGLCGQNGNGGVY